MDIFLLISHYHGLASVSHCQQAVAAAGDGQAYTLDIIYKYIYLKMKKHINEFVRSI